MSDERPVCWLCAEGAMKDGAEIERLRTELATVLDREAATIARYDRTVSVFDNENERLCAQVAKLREG